MARAIDRKMRVGVVMGGLASEREVSLQTGAAVLPALESRGWKAIGIDAGRDLARVLVAKRIDVVWNALHGKFGEDGAVQGLLEVLGIPYTGSGVMASAIAMDKSVSKVLFANAGIPTAPYRLVRREAAEGAPPPAVVELALGLGLPAVVKPTCEGSSVGVSVVRAPEEMPGALAAAFRYDPVVLVEKYVKGRELQVGMLDGEPIGILEIVTKSHAFYDYETKYTAGLAEHIIPAPLDGATATRIGEFARLAYRALSCEGHARVEFILSEADAVPTILEVNTLPGMTKLSLLPEIARHAGIDFPDLCERILLGARVKIPGPARSPRTATVGKSAKSAKSTKKSKPKSKSTRESVRKGKGRMSRD